MSFRGHLNEMTPEVQSWHTIPKVNRVCTQDRSQCCCGHRSQRCGLL